MIFTATYSKYMIMMMASTIMHITYTIGINCQHVSPELKPFQFTLLRSNYLPSFSAFLELVATISIISILQNYILQNLILLIFANNKFIDELTDQKNLKMQEKLYIVVSKITIIQRICFNDMDLVIYSNMNMGEVYIRNLMNGMAMTLFPDGKSKKGGLLRVYNLKKSANQIFTFTNYDGKYLIRNSDSGKVLDLENDKGKVYSEIIGYECHGKSNQQWVIQQQSAGNFYIVSVKSGLVMQIQGGINEQGMRIVQNQRFNNLNQLWKFEKV